MVSGALWISQCVLPIPSESNPACLCQSEFWVKSGRGSESLGVGRTHCAIQSAPLTTSSSLSFMRISTEIPLVTRGSARLSLWYLYIPQRRPDRAVSAKLHGAFIQMTQSILAQGLNSGCNSQILSNSDKSTVVISTIVKFTVVLTKLQVLR